MFQKAHFKDIPKEEIKKKMQQEGFSPIELSDKSGFVYRPHQHEETKYLVCLEGSMKVTTQGKTFNFEPGDKLIIPGNTIHEALVGDRGCVFFWSEKVI